MSKTEFEPKKVELHISDVLRACEVKRWQLVATTKVQSVAEHTFNVIALSMQILHKMRQEGATVPTWAEFAVIKWAFLHDTAEVITGDMPTPVKEVSGAKERLKQIEANISFCGQNCSVPDIGREFGAENGHKTEIEEVVKGADVLDACLFLRYYGVQTPHTLLVHHKLMDRLQDYRIAKELYHEICHRAPAELGDIYNSW